MQDAPDDVHFDFAQEENRCVVSADTDFGTLLALRQRTASSVILLRRPSQRKPTEQVQLLLSNLPEISKPLLQGRIVSIEETRIRIRSLPIGNSG